MDRSEVLNRCIESLVSGMVRSSLPARLLVLDQNSQDGTREALAALKRRFGTQITLLLSDTNLGCAGGRRAMAEHVMRDGMQAADCLIFLDDDIVATSDTWIDDLIRPIRSGQADITGYEGWKVTDTFFTRKADDYDYVGGGRCAIRGGVFLQGCMFDVRFNPNYWEDVDFCLQARERGCRILEVPTVGLSHVSHGGNGAVMLQSREQFLKKWPPERLAAVRQRAI